MSEEEAPRTLRMVRVVGDPFSPPRLCNHVFITRWNEAYLLEMGTFDARELHERRLASPPGGEIELPLFVSDRFVVVDRQVLQKLRASITEILGDAGVDARPEAEGGRG